MDMNRQLTEKEKHDLTQEKKILNSYKLSYAEILFFFF